MTRITLDFDNRNMVKLAYYLLKGTLLCKRLPYMIRKTKRGFHIAFGGLNISEKEMYMLRLRLGDDKKRILLDMTCKKKPKQILFTEKEVYVYQYDPFGGLNEKRRIQ